MENNNNVVSITDAPIPKPVNYVHYDIQLRKVENGWILNKQGKEYLITKPEQVLKYLEEKSK